MNDAISRLDARLSQISNPAPARPAPAAGQAAPGRDGRARRSPGLSPVAADQPGLVRFRDRGNRCAPERTRQFRAAASRTATRRAAPRPRRRRPQCRPRAPRRPGRIFPRSSAICSRSPARSRRCSAPTGSSNRSRRSAANWPKFAHAITEAMPRRAIELIENEIRSLSRRIDDTRQSGTDGQALAGIERALSEIREVLRSLTPAEQLAGYDDAIRNLGAKLDLILRASDDPSTVRQLESAIAALRSIVSNVASNDALVRLSDDVRTLSSKVDQLAASGDSSDSFCDPRTAHRGADLDAGKPRTPGRRPKIPSISKARCGRCPIASTACRSATTAPPLSPISNSACRICSNGSKTSSDHRSGNLGRVEDGLQDILRHLENQHASFAALAESSRNAARRGIRIADRPGRYRQARIDRHPLQPDRDRPPDPGFARGRSQHARPCGRPAGDDRRRSARGAFRAGGAAAARPERRAGRASPPPAIATRRRRRAAMPPQLKPELPNPAAAEPHFAAAPREFHAAQPRCAARRRRAARDQRNPRAACRAAARRDRTRTAAGPSARAGNAADRAAGLALGAHRRFGKRHQRNSGRPSPSPSATSSFIAAARRAAQAAAAAPPAKAGQGRQAGRPPASRQPAAARRPGDKEPSTITSKIRSLLVGASVVVIVLGTFKMAMTLLDSGSPPQPACHREFGRAAGPAQPPAAAKPPRRRRRCLR